VPEQVTVQPQGKHRSPTGQNMHTCPVNVLLPSEVALSRQAYLKEPCEFGVPEGDMGGVGVGPGIDAHPQGGQGQVDALCF